MGALLATDVASAASACPVSKKPRVYEEEEVDAEDRDKKAEARAWEDTVAHDVQHAALRSVLHAAPPDFVLFFD